MLNQRRLIFFKIRVNFFNIRVEFICAHVNAIWTVHTDIGPDPMPVDAPRYLSLPQEERTLIPISPNSSTLNPFLTNPLKQRNRLSSEPSPSMEQRKIKRIDDFLKPLFRSMKEVLTLRAISRKKSRVLEY